jgi:hypothetical protein
MSPALAAIIVIAATHIATAAQLRPKDLVGAWTVGGGPDYTYYTFWSDFHYTGSQGDALYRGTWKLLDRGRKLELILGGGVPKDQLPVPPTREVIIIDSFDRHTLHVTLVGGKKDVWKKMPRWRGSPKY